MIYKNAYIFTPDRGFVYGSFGVEDGKFCDVLSAVDCPEAVDLKGTYVIPGLIDVHNHGNSGEDFSDGDYDGLVRMGMFLAKNGVTSFAPATMTLPYSVIAQAFSNASRLNKNRPADCARLMGVQMEGPYFSEKKKGAQNADYLKLPDLEGFKMLFEDSDGIVKIVDVAPELEGAAEFTKGASKLCTVSVAHTDSDYEHAAEVFASGATHLTHLYNAMPSIHHRKPGVIGAASECENVTAELICDGLHVHPSAVRMAFKLFPGRICLISDALRCTGMPDGDYPFGGQTMTLKNGEARMPDGALAGSVTVLYDCMRKAVEFGIDKTAAILAATLTPAKEIGCADLLGSIENGKLADFVLCDENLTRKAVYINGTQIA